MKLSKNTNAQVFILKAYKDGMRTKDILDILCRDFDVVITPRTLYRFIIKNNISRWHIWHKEWYENYVNNQNNTDNNEA